MGAATLYTISRLATLFHQPSVGISICFFAGVKTFLDQYLFLPLKFSKYQMRKQFGSEHYVHNCLISYQEVDLIVFQLIIWNFLVLVFLATKNFGFISLLVELF
jgi:hypothetical protein